MKPGKLLLALLCVPVLLLSACTTKRSEFTITDVTVQDVRDMAEDGDTFLLLVEREGCEFCQAMNDYIEETKGDHPEVHLFRLDTTDFDLVKENAEDKTLVSSTEEGKEWLKLQPYFLYTPAIEVHLFRLDTTDFDLVKENAEDKTLVSSTEEGKEWLKLQPYFLYTPAIYRYENGKSDEAAIGYNVVTEEISLWNTTSTIDFDAAKTEGLWEFLER